MRKYQRMQFVCLLLSVLLVVCLVLGLVATGILALVG